MFEMKPIHIPGEPSKISSLQDPATLKKWQRLLNEILLVPGFSYYEEVLGGNSRKDKINSSVLGICFDCFNFSLNVQRIDF